MLCWHWWKISNLKMLFECYYNLFFLSHYYDLSSRNNDFLYLIVTTYCFVTTTLYPGFYPELLGHNSENKNYNALKSFPQQRISNCLEYFKGGDYQRTAVHINYVNLDVVSLETFPPWINSSSIHVEIFGDNTWLGLEL